MVCWGHGVGVYTELGRDVWASCVVVGMALDMKDGSGLGDCDIEGEERKDLVGNRCVWA